MPPPQKLRGIWYYITRGKVALFVRFFRETSIPILSLSTSLFSFKRSLVTGEILKNGKIRLLGLRGKKKK